MFCPETKIATTKLARDQAIVTVDRTAKMARATTRKMYLAVALAFATSLGSSGFISARALECSLSEFASGIPSKSTTDKSRPEES